MCPTHNYGIYLLMPTQLFQLFELVSSPLQLARAAVDIRQVRPVPHRLTMSARFPQFGQRSRELSLLNAGLDKRAGARKIGIHLADGAKLFDGTVILPGEVKNCSMVPGNDHRERIKLASPLAFRQGLIKAPLERTALRLPLVGR